MIKGLSEYEKFRVLRPIIGGAQMDENNFPIISKEQYIESDWCNMNITGLQNVSPKYNYKDYILLMFNYDYRLNSLWNNPLKNRVISEFLCNSDT